MGAFVFSVVTAAAEDRQLVEDLFRDVPPPPSGARAITEFSLLRSDAEGRAWLVSGQRLENVEVATLGGALNLLMGELNFAALEAEPDDLHLHAALAVKQGRAVVIAGEANVGKTTTVAHLAARGWAYATDERVRLSPRATSVTGLVKPLSIKPIGREHVAHLEPWMVPPVGEGPEDFRFVPVGASGATVVAGGEPHVVVLLRRPFSAHPGTGPNADRLHPADAVVALMQESLDAERFGSAAEQLSALAAASHCYDVTIGSPDETADTIEALFELDSVEPLQVLRLPDSQLVSASVVSLLFRDRVVIHDQRSGRILALDPGGTRVWMQLGGWTVDDIDVDGPVIGPFVAQLRQLGVLAGAA